MSNFSTAFIEGINIAMVLQGTQIVINELDLYIILGISLISIVLGFYQYQKVTRGKK